MAPSLSLRILLTIFLCFNSHFQTLPHASQSYLEFKYMQFVYDAANLPSEEYYDYIVIGGGTAGCPLAATLSKSYSVLVSKEAVLRQHILIS
ncbi:hypothetical protein TIFTF001_049092 [Ficus carica]|uniref:Glucose-methanol-choline oxidoreductase N-terminal domain-containing protein n=1 Tax=Ficus carica TaxID=3494 RepID=A0AA88CMK5_FICCA|nr:hypothetical protein TIFTF001_049092 [Ficus carica]